MTCALNDRRRFALSIVIFVLFIEGLALAGCSSDALSSSDAGQPKDAARTDSARVDSAVDGSATDASQCGATISAYCGADAGTCQTPISPVFATDWTSELTKACATSTRVTVASCGDYMVLTLGSVDTSVTLYYLRSTGALVTIDESPFTPNELCVAGASLYPTACPADAMQTSLCPSSDGGIN